MNTNYEAVASLIELLVKKAGFDITKDYSESELKKTRDSIETLLKKKTTATSKKTVAQIIDNLKIREANWENNAEIVGKKLLEAYKAGKSYESVKDKIDYLGSLAMDGTSSISVGSVYDKLKNLEVEYEALMDKINNSDYSNKEERAMDERYKVYLENKIESLDSEINSLEAELDSLREVELKDESIVNELKEYLLKLEGDKDKINQAAHLAMNSDVQFDVWERLEKAKVTTKDKLIKSSELLKRTEEMILDVRNTRNSINDRKLALNAEKSRCSNKLNTISSKLTDGKYENSPERMIDINNSLSNKKDVIYVDANKVKEELIKEWSQGKSVGTMSRDVKVESPVIKHDSIDKSTTNVNELDKTLEDLKEIIDKSKIIRDNIVDNTSHDISDIEDVSESEDVESITFDDVSEVPSTKEVLQVIEDEIRPIVEPIVREEKQEKKNKMELDW